MIILIIALLISCLVLLAQFTGNYSARVGVMRKLFRDKGTVPVHYLQRVSVLQDIDYGSTFPDGKLDIYTANDSAGPQPVLLWIHGGGYVGSNKSCLRTWGYALAAELHVAVVGIDYCLAPEQHYPVPLLQVGEALRFLSANSERFRLDDSRVFLAGDSAGAQIASQYAALVCNPLLREQMHILPPLDRDRLKGVLLCCGFYDMDTVLDSRFPAIKTFLWAYTHCKKIAKFPRKDEMSTVRQITPDYCDVFLTCGGDDPFFRQAQQFEKALVAAAVPVISYLPGGQNAAKQNKRTQRKERKQKQPTAVVAEPKMSRDDNAAHNRNTIRQDTACPRQSTETKRIGHEYQFLIGTPEADTALRTAEKFIEERL